MKKPDRWERIVGACNFNDRSDAADAVKLLRQEHRWVRRMVQDYNERSMKCCWETTTTDVVIGFELACTLILNKLKERAK